MKKSLSILLALLMILSSLPIMTFAASAEQATTNPNVLADTVAADWGAKTWSKIVESDEPGFLVTSPRSQKIFTVVELDANSTYNFGFSWKSILDNSEASYPQNIHVYPYSRTGDVFVGYETGAPAGSGIWDDSANFHPLAEYGGDLTSTDDLETANDVSGKCAGVATNGLWNNYTTSFTTTTDTKYVIMIGFGFTNSAATQIKLNGFSLIKPTDFGSIPVEERLASEFGGFQHSKVIDDPSITADGITSDIRVDNANYQNLYFTVPASPNNINTLSFKYYTPSSNSKLSSVKIYPETIGDITKEFDPTGWYEGTIGSVTYYGEFVPAKGNAGIATGTSLGDNTAADSWQTATITFPTDDVTKYHVIMHFDPGSGTAISGGRMYFADFKCEELVKTKPGNILNGATYANGDVSWSKTITSNAHGDMEARMSFASGLDNPAFSINGGYAWGFGFGYGTLTGDNYGYVYINAKGLKANATYDFSYIYVNDFRFVIDSIKSGDNTVTNYIVEPTIETMADYKAEKVSTMFTAPADGDYVITLRTSRDSAYRMSWITWSTTYLCDLELYERGAMYDVSVSTEGNGFAKADKTGLTEEGTSVTFTAKAETYEQFLGWYVGDELVSEDLTYITTVEGALAPVAKFTTNSENLMADYTASNFGAEPNGTVSDSSETNYGGNGVYAAKVPHQNFFTTVTLEAGKKYTFGFNWKSEANIYNKLYPNTISVFQKAAGDPFDASSWDDSKWPPYQGDTTTYPDIESGGPYTTQDLANTCTWQSVTTGFTPTETTEYVIMIALTFAMQDTGDGQGTVHHNNNQGIYFSDFVLKEVYVDKSNLLAGLGAFDWRTMQWSNISASSDTYGDSNAYLVGNAMSQNINTTLTLKPGTKYTYSFKWKALDHETGYSYIAHSSIYSANSGDPTAIDGGNYLNNDTPVYVPDEGYANLMTDVVNDYNADDMTSWLDWNTYSATFTTIEDAEYYLFLNFGLKLLPGVAANTNTQAVVVSDFVLREVVEGTAPAADDMIAHPGVSIRKASESTFGQALRYKFTIDGGVIANAQADGYELVEYGTVVALASELNGHAADPILNATAYTVRTGVAYDTANGINKQFAVAANGDVTYTAALYNIPTANYGADIAVRPYAKFKNAEGESYIRYGTTRMASVFAVVEEVLAGSNADDIAYVNGTMLVGDVLNAYNEWLANK